MHHRRHIHESEYEEIGPPPVLKNSIGAIHHHNNHNSLLAINGTNSLHRITGINSASHNKLSVSTAFLSYSLNFDLGREAQIESIIRPIFPAHAKLRLLPTKTFNFPTIFVRTLRAPGKKIFRLFSF